MFFIEFQGSFWIPTELWVVKWYPQNSGVDNSGGSDEASTP